MDHLRNKRKVAWGVEAQNQVLWRVKCMMRKIVEGLNEKEG